MLTTTIPRRPAAAVPRFIEPCQGVAKLVGIPGSLGIDRLVGLPGVTKGVDKLVRSLQIPRLPIVRLPQIQPPQV